MILTKNSLTIIVTITVVLSIFVFHDVESFHCCPLLQQQQQQQQQQKQAMIPTPTPILRQAKSNDEDEDEDNGKDRRRSASVMNRRESVVRSILLPLVSSVPVVAVLTNNNNRAMAYDANPDPLQVRIVCVCMHHFVET